MCACAGFFKIEVTMQAIIKKLASIFGLHSARLFCIFFYIPQYFIVFLYFFISNCYFNFLLHVSFLFFILRELRRAGAGTKDETVETASPERELKRAGAGTKAHKGRS